MNTQNKKHFKGVLSFVDDQEREIQIDSLNIVEKDFITFNMHALDDSENYIADIRCDWDEKDGGCYFSNLGEIKKDLYSDYVNLFALKVTQLIQSGNECKIEALWIQDQHEYQVNGILS